MKNFIFLDLEETVIDEWSSGLFLPENLVKINRFLHGKDIWDSPTPFLNMRVGLMSWAVWNDKDKKVFNEEFRAPLEEALEIKFDDELVRSMDDWSVTLMECSRHLNDRQLLHDFGKEFLLRKMMDHKDFIGSSMWLIDDAVEHHLHFNSRKTKTSVEFVNIKEM